MRPFCLPFPEEPVMRRIDRKHGENHERQHQKRIKEHFQPGQIKEFQGHTELGHNKSGKYSHRENPDIHPDHGFAQKTGVQKVQPDHQQEAQPQSDDFSRHESVHVLAVIGVFHHGPNEKWRHQQLQMLEQALVGGRDKGNQQAVSGPAIDEVEQNPKDKGKNHAK